MPNGTRRRHSCVFMDAEILDGRSRLFGRVASEIREYVSTGLHLRFEPVSKDRGTI